MSRFAWLTAVALACCSAGALAAEPSRAPLPSDDLFTNPARAAHRFDEFVYPAEERKTEAEEKVARVRKLLAARKLDGLVIATERNFNWVTAGGADNVVWAQRESPVKLLITPDRLHLIADNIEGPRVMTEEVQNLGYDWKKYPWHGKEADALEPLIKGKRIAFDLPAAAIAYRREPSAIIDLKDIYYPITAGELKKYRWLGRKTAEVLEQVARVVRPGMTERDVQYLLAREFWYWDIFPTVILSAVDDRFQTYKHPVVTGKELRSYVALNVCTRRWGLTVSTTRLVHFGEPPAALKKAWEDGPKVAAAMWAASRPGNTLGDVVRAAQEAYARVGHPNEWKLHHQGGMILTLERLYLAPPDDRTAIIPGMVLAWNPTLQGAKFEDTVVVKPDGTLENLTASRNWPTVSVTVGERKFEVPGLLIRPKPE